MTCQESGNPFAISNRRRYSDTARPYRAAPFAAARSDMITFLRLGFPAVAVSVAVALMPLVTCAQYADIRDGAGIVWFVGSVLPDNPGRARIDLGDAHALSEGDALAVFRARDNHFVPMGTIRVSQSLATWSIPAATARFKLETGDRVAYVRTLHQLGTGPAFLDHFLRQQIVKTSHRNGYSTVRQLEEADVLERFLIRQPRWQRNQEHIAGTILSSSVSRKDLQEMQPLLNQVMKFQDYQSLGVPIEQTTGAAWTSVLKTLTPADIELFDSIEFTAITADDGNKPAETDPIADSAESTKQIGAIRRHVDALLFLRQPEERNVVTIICAALEKAQPQNERQWYSLQLRGTQFAALADEKQLLDEFELVMRRVRAEE